MSAETQTRPPGRPDDLTVMVEAAGALVGWEAATFVCLTGSSPGVGRSWHASGGQATAKTPAPTWVWGLDADTWTHQRSVWRPGSLSDRDRSAAAVVVPVRRDARLEGVLAFHGAGVEEPPFSAVSVLEGVATLLARSLDSVRSAPSDAAGSGPVPLHALPMVDVFAYTLRVADQGLEWLYCGPNASAVFGGPVTTDVSLVQLIREHAHPEDLGVVGELEDAMVRGRASEVEIRVIGGDGVTRWTSWRAVPRVTEDGLCVDGVATDISSRHSLGEARRHLALANEQLVQEVDVRRRHVLAVRDANDNVLQRLFGAGLRLQILRRKLDDAEAHAVSAIAFQLDQAATDLRELIIDLNTVIGHLPQTGPPSS